VSAIKRNNWRQPNAAKLAAKILTRVSERIAAGEECITSLYCDALIMWNLA
jgi:hypothetical protein